MKLRFRGRMPLLLLMILSLFSIGTSAQINVEKTEAVINRIYKQYLEEKAKGNNKSARDLELKMFDLELDIVEVKLEEYLKALKKSELEWRSWQSDYKHQPGEVNLIPALAGVPSPEPNLPTAAVTDLEARYEGYVRKMEMLQKQVADQQMRDNKYRNADQESLKKDALKETNRNPVIQQMGGAENIMQMSEAERKLAAQQAVSNMRNNPSTGNAGMDMMMQKIMNDQSYRERYNKMSDAEKAAELKKFMTTAGSNEIKRNDAAFEATMKDRSETMRAIQLQKLLAETAEKLQQVAAQVTPAMNDAVVLYDEIYKTIENWYRKTYEALPYVVVGEMREKEGLHELLQMKAVLLYAVQKREAATMAKLWELRKTGTIYAIGTFNEYAGKHKWGIDQSGELMKGTYLEPQIAETVHGIYGTAIAMTKEAKLMTSENKGRQKSYEMIVK